MIENFEIQYYKFAKELGYSVSMEDLDFIDGNNEKVEVKRLFMNTSPSSPIGLRSDILKREPYWNSLWGYIRTSSWAFDGERSDLHDLISSILAITLRISNVSTSLLTLDHPLTDLYGVDFTNEIHARIVSFERHNLMSFQLSQENELLIKKIINSTYLTAFLMDNVFSYTEPHKPNPSLYHEKAIKIATILGVGEKNENFNYMARKQPFWGWFRSFDTGISVFELGEHIISKLRYLICELYNPKKLDGIDKKIILTDGIGNAIDLKKLSKGLEILDLLEGKISDIEVIPIEDRFFIFGKQYIISVDDDCSDKTYKYELKAIKRRQEFENSVLFPITEFVWNTKINGERFEKMIRDLFAADPNVRWVKRVSSGTQGDGGRDLELEKVFKKAFVADSTEPPYVIKKILVQCKAYQSNVNKSNVRDIRDTIDMHRADGYHLVVSSQLTTQLFDYLSSLRDRGMLIDWWTRDDIEDLLRVNPEIANRYPDIVTF